MIFEFAYYYLEMCGKVVEIPLFDQIITKESKELTKTIQQIKDSFREKLDQLGNPPEEALESPISLNWKTAMNICLAEREKALKEAKKSALEKLFS